MKKIVVPIDFSELSVYAVQTAADICRMDENCLLQLVHVYEKPISGLTLQLEIDNQELHKVRDEMNEKFDELSKIHLKGINADKVFIADVSMTEMLNMDIMKDVDLIVMGTHGVRGWKELILGSNAQRIVRNALCPVMVIKDYKETFAIENAVFVSDFMEKASTSYMRIKPILDLFHPKVHLLKVFDEEFDEDNNSVMEMGSFIDKSNLKNYSINYRKASSVESGLNEFCEEVGADAVFIETHGRKSIDRFLQSSIAEKLVNHLSIPVITVRLED